MGFFSDIARVKYVAEVNAIRLSLRTDESTVEEFLLPLADMYSFANTDLDEFKWVGDGCIQGRRDATSGLVRIQVDFNKRSLFRMPRSSFDLMMAQVRSEVVKGDLDGARLVFSQVRPRIDATELKDKIQESLDLTRFRAELLHDLEVLIKRYVGQTTVLPVSQQASPVSVTRVEIKRSEPRFIPSDLGKKQMQGTVKITRTASESSMDEAAELLKQSKRSKK
ncbi:hypothetical protein CMI47_10590 [Candidatus Pacearchaeota archaeon]|nr:hypothetical protein [Candidatus Pacearchaeota archaeon]|tara:strand:- start:148 stop:816 length:669 start_codon:yes stop_codon:yes gene_type:complete